MDQRSGMCVGRSDHNYEPQGSHSTTDHRKLESEAGHAQSTEGPWSRLHMSGFQQQVWYLRC